MTQPDISPERIENAARAIVKPLYAREWDDASAAVKASAIKIAGRAISAWQDREGGGGDNEKGESALRSRQVPHTPEPAPLSPGRVENAAQAVRQAWQDHGSADFDTFTAEAVLRADTEWQREYVASSPEVAMARVRDQALAAIAAIRPDQQSDWSIPDAARDEACDEIRAEFLRRIGEQGETDADS